MTPEQEAAIRKAARHYDEVVAIFSENDVLYIQRGYAEQEVGAAVSEHLSGLLAELDAAREREARLRAALEGLEVYAIERPGVAVPLEVIARAALALAEKETT